MRWWACFPLSLVELRRTSRFAHPTWSLRRDVLPVVHGQDDARAIIQAVTILFGEVVDALTCRDFLLGHERLADAFTELRRARLAGFQRHRNDALEHFERVIG